MFIDPKLPIFIYGIRVNPIIFELEGMSRFYSRTQTNTVIDDLRAWLLDNKETQTCLLQQELGAQFMSPNKTIYPSVNTIGSCGLFITFDIRYVSGEAVAEDPTILTIVKEPNLDLVFEFLIELGLADRSKTRAFKQDTKPKWYSSYYDREAYMLTT